MAEYKHTMRPMNPCPNCGCDPVIEKGRKKYYVICYECGPKFKTGYYLTAKEAIKAWNRRMFK